MNATGTSEQVRSGDGTVIAMRRSGSGPALVLVDAAGSFRGYGPMVPLAEPMATAFTVHTYDRRGRGESTDETPGTAGYTVEREIDDLRAVIDAAGGSAMVYGFSSGAVLALHAAAAGLPISRLALMEPPIEIEDRAGPVPLPELAVEIDALVAAGRRGDAIEHFHQSIGVPPEYVAGLRHDPMWTALEALAHTLVYDSIITSTLSGRRLRSITTPTLVIDSIGSDDRLRGWARAVAAALPAGEHGSLPGEWHGVAITDLAAALTEFLAA